MKKSIVRALILGLALAIPAGYALADAPTQTNAVIRSTPVGAAATSAKPMKKGKKGGKKKKKAEAPPPATP